MARVVSWFSCGAASAVATKLAIAEHKEVTIVYCEVIEEHPDNKRFLKDCEKWFGQEIIVMGNDKYKRSIYEVFDKTRYLAGVGGARCTLELKKNIRREFERPDDIQVFGYTVEEQNRLDRFIDANNYVNLIVPLIDKGLDKSDCLAMIQDAGIELPEMYKLGYKNNNCLSGETKIITDKGAVKIKSIVDKPTMIRTSKGFELSTVKCYGQMPCYEIDIERDGMVETITSSYNHRWYVRPRRYRDELVVVPSLALQVGFKIPTAYKGTITEIDSEGIRHGIVFGDGHYENKEKTKTGVKLCGEKKELSKYFPSYKGVKGCISGQPAHYKKLPSFDYSQAYLAGFVAGLMATDGSFRDGVTFDQVKNMGLIKSIFESIGISTQKIKHIKGSTNFKDEREIDHLRIISASFPSELDIRNKRKNFRSNHRAGDGEIIAIRKTTNRLVYCPTTSTHDIVLEYGIITGQCRGCVKAESPAYWKKIQIDFPEYFEAMLAQEKRLNVCICKATIDGVKDTRMQLDSLPSHIKPMDDTQDIQCGIFCEMAKSDYTK